ncbi:MAG: hypothetical protein AAFY60_21035, partial [Myxococcota bacterium]
NGERLAPSTLRRELDALIDRGRMQDVADPDAVVSAALARLSPKDGALRGDAFLNAARSDKPVWAPDYLTPLSGPSLARLLEPIPTFEQFSDARGMSEELEAPLLAGRKRSFTRERDDYARDLEKLEAIATQLDGDRWLTNLLTHSDGLSGKLGQQLDTLLTSVNDAVDHARNLVSEMGQGLRRKTIEDARLSMKRTSAFVEELSRRHNDVMELISAAVQQEGFKLTDLLGGLFGTKKSKNDGAEERVRAGLEHLEASHLKAMDFVEEAFEQYPAETRSLRELLAPRIEYRRTIAGSDPALTITDGMWLPFVAAELRRATASAQNLRTAVHSLPDDFPGRPYYVEQLESAGDLRRILV